MSGNRNIDPSVGKATQWKPGKSGNPRGTPKVIPNLDTYIIDLLTEEGASGRDGLRVILEALRKKAAAGDVRAIELLLDRAYGKVKQTFDQNIIGNIAINVTNEDATLGE